MTGSAVATDHATAAIVERVAAEGHAIAPEFLPPHAVTALHGHAEALDAAGLFAPARTGRGAARAVRADVRGDRIAWIDIAAVDDAERPLLAALERLRENANRELALGLFDLELHYAIYPAGAGYARHVDRFRDDDARVLSFVLYLNTGWTPADGGALTLDASPRRSVAVLPVAGTLVAFLSERVAHAVHPARRPRYSIAGWFRRRS